MEDISVAKGIYLAPSLAILEGQSNERLLSQPLANAPLAIGCLVRRQKLTPGLAGSRPLCHNNPFTTSPIHA